MGSSGQGDRPWQSYHTVFTNAKAGMEGVDKEKVQKMVYEMSKGSKFFENEQRKEAYIQQKIDSMQARRARLSANEITHFQMIADKMITELDASRDLSKVWLHTDMDAFYAAVETLHNPSLKGKPLAVGSMSMICTANYEARKYGVRAAMPGFIACKLCPDLIFVPTDFEKYTHYSELTRKVFQKYDPNFIATSLDEAYLNITDICTERGISGEEIAKELRNAIFEETGLTCSAGVAPNRMLAKVCSDINKPNGQYILPNDSKAVMSFISGLPIRKIGGIGKVTQHVFKSVLDISTCEEILQRSGLVCALFTHCSSQFFLSVGLGLGQTEPPEFKMRKSISCERTFSATNDLLVLDKKLEELANALSDDMQKASLYGRTLTLKIKMSTFEVRTRATTLQVCIRSKEDILQHARMLLKAELPVSLRLLGLRMSHLQDNKLVPLDPRQTTLEKFAISHESSFDVASREHCEVSKLESHSSYEWEWDNTAGFNDEISFKNDLYSSDTACSSKGADGSLISNSLSSVNFGLLADGNDVSKKHKPNNIEEGQVDCSSTSINQGEQSIWIDGYICSICGIELPSTFLEERQDHSDYHLAEILQKEENEHTARDISNKRCLSTTVSRGPHTKERLKKNPKHSHKQKNQLPIYSFFDKNRTGM